MAEYQALVAYIGVLLVVFFGGLLWMRYRTGIKRKLNLKSYSDTHSQKPHENQENHAQTVSR